MMLRLFLRIVAALVAVMIVACEKPELESPEQEVPEQEIPEQEKPEQEKPGTELPPLGENMFEIDGVQSSFGSIAVSNFGEYVCIAATPVEGIEEFSDIFEQEEYFYTAISPLLNGKEIDLMSEETLYTVISTLKSAEILMVSPTSREEIVSGTSIFDYTEGIADVEAEYVLAGGAALKVKLNAEEPGIIVNENLFSIDDNPKPVRAAFSMVEDGVTALYLTPAGISFFDELEVATYYAYIVLDESRCHGRTLSVSDLLAVGYVDNINGVIVDSGEVPVTGTVNVASDPDDPYHYVVAVDLDFNGSTLEIRFDGTTVDADVKEVVENEFIYQDKSYGIKGVSIGLKPGTEDVYLVEVRTGCEDVLTISLPAKFLDGNAHGFSQSQDLYIEYDGAVYSKAAGSSGTVTVGISDGIMKLEATNYDNIQLVYEGPYEGAI